MTVSARFVWSADEIRRVGYRVADIIAEHLTTIPSAPVFQPVPAPTADALLHEPTPRAGEPPDAVLDDFERFVAPYPFGNGHPRFYGWVNSPPAVMGIFASALAAALNPSVAGGNHAAVWIEREVADWLKGMLGFPRDGMGLFVSGGSAAAITALAVARHVACRQRGWDVRADGLWRDTDRGGRPLVYMSAEAHSCHRKAVELLGLGSASVRDVPTDTSLRMRPDRLAAMLRDDLAGGGVPVAVVASAGTVNTGVIDPLTDIADVCDRDGIWLHVDGAYGAPAALVDAYRDELSALGRASSLAIDPHKWLYVPVDAGMVFVRDAQAMRDAFSLVPPYLRTDGNAHGVQGPPWLSEYGIEQTRPFRGLKMWMTLKALGADGYRDLIEHDIALARYLSERVRSLPDVELWEPRSLSIVCFRVVPPALHDRPAVIDELNQRVVREIQLGGTGFLTSTALAGRTWLRACIVNPRASERDIDAVVDAVYRAAMVAVRETVRSPA